MADGQIHLPVECGYFLVLDKVLWILATGPAALLGDHILGQAVYLDSVVVVGLLGIIETVKFLVDLEMPVPVGAPGLDMLFEVLRRWLWNALAIKIFDRIYRMIRILFLACPGVIASLSFGITLGKPEARQERSNRLSTMEQRAFTSCAARD